MALLIEKATTNYIPNPIAANGAHEIAATGGATRTVVNDNPMFGANCIRSVGAANDAGIRWQSNSGLGLTGEPYTFTGSIYLRGTGNVDVSMMIQYTDDTYLTGGDIPVTIDADNWQRFHCGTLVSDPDKTINRVIVQARQNGAGTSDFYADGAQVEPGSVMTSLTCGSFGDGFAFTGTNHASTSTRNASSLNLPAGILNSERGAIAVRARPQPTLGTEACVLDVGNVATGEDLVQIRYQSNGSILMIWYLDGTVDADITTFDVPPLYERALYYAAWDGDDFTLRLNDLPAINSTRGSGRAGFRVDRRIHLGTDRVGARHINGPIEDVVVFHRPLTDAEYDRLFAAESWTWSTIWE